MAKNNTESPELRNRRFQRAKKKSEDWKSYLDEMYSLALPVRDIFEDVQTGDNSSNRGNARNLRVFDATAVQKLPVYASQIQSLLTPANQTWMRLKPGPEIIEANRKIVQEQLDKITTTFFFYLNRSDFYQASATSNLDMGISTGILKIDYSGDPANPLSIESQNLRDTFFEEVQGKLRSFWRVLEIEGGRLQTFFPKATISSDLSRTIAKDPLTELKLIEGTVFHPGNPPSTRYTYYIQLEGDPNTDIFNEARSSSPWAGYRSDKSPNESYGRGPIEQIFPFIKVANRLMQQLYVSASYKISPVITMPITQSLNPFTFNMVPGALIGIEDQYVGRNAFQAIQFPETDPLVVNILQELRSVIKEALLDDPLGPVGGATPSATEVTVRTTLARRIRAASIGRLNAEFVMPVIEKVLAVLARQDLISPIQITGKDSIPVVVDRLNVDIELISPTNSIQNEEDVNNLELYFQQINNALGPALGPVMSLIANKFEKIPTYLGDKLNIPAELIPSSADITKILQDAQAEVVKQQAAASPQAAALPGSAANAPIPILPGGTSQIEQQFSPSPRGAR